MPLVLALEPDPRQAEALKPLIEQRVRAELLLADSKDAAIAALADRVPDLILVSALLSPRDEADLTDHLRTLEGATHLQTLTIPLLGGAAWPAPAKRRRGLFGALQRQAAPPTTGCDPHVFAEQVLNYLDRAQELKAEAATHALHAAPAGDTGPGGFSRPRETRVLADREEPGAAPREASSSYWDWDAPSAAGFPRASSSHAAADTPAAEIDQHPPTVLDAAEALLGQPAAEDPSSPLSALVEQAGAGHVTLDPFALADHAGLDDNEPGKAAAMTGFEEVIAPSAHDDAAAAHPAPPVEEGRPTRRRQKRELARRAQVAERDREVGEVAKRERDEHDETVRQLSEQLAGEQAAREQSERESRERERLTRAQAERNLAAWEETAAARERQAREEGALELSAQAERGRAERDRIEKEGDERTRRVREEATRELAARDQAAREAAERERAAREQAERELAAREAREQDERERVAREADERARVAREETERELTAREQAAREAAERELAAREAHARELAERLAREQDERERVAREADEHARVAREEAERERAVRELAVCETAERERAAREQAERDAVDRERVAREQAVREAAEQAREETRRELTGREEAVRKEAERERRAREQAERDLAVRDAEARALAERLARAQADREQADRERLVKELAAQAQALSEAVRAAQQLPAVQAQLRPASLRQPRRASKPKKARPRTASHMAGDLQDEWGVYDPAVCGFDALYEKLEAAEAGREREEEAPSAGDLLVRANGSRAHRPGVPALGQRGPRPLAMWARRSPNDTSEPPKTNGHGANRADETGAVIRTLLVPAAIAAVRYAGGCRIRRVRVKASGGRPRRVPNAPVIILSKRLLDELRPRAGGAGLY